MGWSSGTQIFDTVCKAVLATPPKSPEETIRALASAMEDADWDTQSESDFWKHPVVRKVMQELHPSWFDERGREL